MSRWLPAADPGLQMLSVSPTPANPCVPARPPRPCRFAYGSHQAAERVPIPIAFAELALGFPASPRQRRAAAPLAALTPVHRTTSPPVRVEPPQRGSAQAVPTLWPAGL